MKMLRADADAVFLVECQCFRIDRDQELFFIGCSDDAVALDSGSHEHDRTNRPMVFAVVIVVRWSASHFALHDNHDFVADLKFLGSRHEIVDAG